MANTVLEECTAIHTNKAGFKAGMEKAMLALVGSRLTSLAQHPRWVLMQAVECVVEIWQSVLGSWTADKTNNTVLRMMATIVSKWEVHDLSFSY